MMTNTDLIGCRAISRPRRAAGEPLAANAGEPLAADSPLSSAKTGPLPAASAGPLPVNAGPWSSSSNLPVTLGSAHILHPDPERWQGCWRNAPRSGRGRAEAGLDGGAGLAPIIPTPSGQKRAATAISTELNVERFLLPLVTCPAVPRGHARLRATATSLLIDDTIGQAVAVAGRVVGRHIETGVVL